MLDNGPPIVAYLAACSLMPQTTYATLDLQANDLIPRLTQTNPQSWKLWSSEAEPVSLNFTADIVR